VVLGLAPFQPDCDFAADQILDEGFRVDGYDLCLDGQQFVLRDR
jgi:hypothetical protein